MPSDLQTKVSDNLKSNGVPPSTIKKYLKIFDTADGHRKRLLLSASSNLRGNDQALSVLAAYDSGSIDILTIEVLIIVRERNGMAADDPSDSGSGMDELDQLPVVMHETCGVCKIPGTVVQTDYSQKRSADEGATVSFKCKRCRREWSK